MKKLCPVTGKRCYEIRNHARRDMERLARTTGTTQLNVYKCEECGNFHIGHLPGRIQMLLGKFGDISRYPSDWTDVEEKIYQRATKEGLLTDIWKPLLKVEGLGAIPRELASRKITRAMIRGLKGAQ